MCFRTLLTAGLIVVMSTPSLADSGDYSDPAAGALAAFAVSGAVTQVATHSKVRVVVEVFNETEALDLDPEILGENEIQRMDIEDRRGAPFKLGKPSAAHRLVGQSADPIEHPTPAKMAQIHGRLAPQMQRIAKRMSCLRSLSSDLAAMPGTPFATAKGTVDKIVALATDAQNTWLALDQAYQAANQSPPMTQEELAGLASLIGQIRSALSALAAVTPSDEFVTVVKFQLKNAYENDRDAEVTAANITPVPDSSAESAAIGQSLAALSNDATLTQRLAALLFDARSLAQSKLTNRSATYDQVLKQFCIDMTTSDLLPLRSVELVAQHLRNTGGVGVVEVAELARSTNAITLDGVTTTANIGPIVNEATQTVLSKSRYIDYITAPENRHKWRKWAEARSSARLGNHNVIVYLDGAASPVLKEAAYDPSAFIQANGMMYRRAWETSVDLLGLPAATQATGATGSASAPTGAPNMWELRQSLNQEASALAKQKSQLLQSLRVLVNHSNAIANPPAGATSTALAHETKAIIMEESAKISALSK